MQRKAAGPSLEMAPLLRRAKAGVLSMPVSMVMWRVLWVVAMTRVWP